MFRTFLARTFKSKSESVFIMNTWFFKHILDQPRQKIFKKKKKRHCENDRIIFKSFILTLTIKTVIFFSC